MNDETLQNKIIEIIRHYFNDKPCKEWTTGFQRHCAKDIINKVREDKKEVEDFDNAIEMLCNEIKELEAELEEVKEFVHEFKDVKNEHIKDLINHNKELQFDNADLEKLYSQSNEVSLELAYKIEALKEENDKLKKESVVQTKEYKKNMKRMYLNLQEYEKCAESWMNQYQELKDKYEPEMLVESKKD